MQKISFDQLNPKDFILIKGARVHNLKNIDVAIPRNKLVVITGLSGSGKSSLAFNTLYAEGQRRYVESLSSYARQFLGKVEKPDVDYIKGVAPAIAIEQKVNSTNSRSTVGTTTEIYDYLKLLYARIGKTISPITGKEIQRDSVQDVTKFVLQQKIGTTVYILANKKLNSSKPLRSELELLSQQGYSRVLHNNEVVWIEDLFDTAEKIEEIKIIVDRFIVASDFEDEENRIADSIETAYFEGKSSCFIHIENEENKTLKEFNNLFEEDGHAFIEPSVNLFTFNNPIGACPTCEGFGMVIGIDEDVVIPNKSLTVYQDAIACWKGEKMQEWKNQLIQNTAKFDFPIHKPIFELTNNQYELLWNGNKYFDGLNQFFDFLSSQSYKIHYRVMLARYRGRTTCPDCKGTRLRKDASYVKVNQKSIHDLVFMSIEELADFFTHIKLDKNDKTVSKRILQEINNRLTYLINVGVSYLNLNRGAATLSGGESQRINLATSLGSSLVGSMYILDEPSIGLHSKDTEKLIVILKSLRDLGNTVIIVEHDEEIIKAADEVIDLGPLAGREGGELVFQGSQQDLLKADTLTAKYIRKELKVIADKKARKWNNSIKVIGARENNLKGINVEIPLNAMTVVSGVSGSGKTSLIKKIVYPAIQKRLGGYGDKTGYFEKLEGEIDLIQEVQYIDQNPIGKSSRSNPVTYIKAYDEIRNLFASIGLAKSRGYKPSHFSFNVEGGRCEVCQGEGEVTEEMQFMADIHLVCEECEGKRFKDEILEVRFQQKNIADVLDLTIADAVDFFNSFQDKKTSLKVAEKLSPLLEVGLGYVKLGQSSGTLSGGEAQRIKLASYLGKGTSSKPILFIFDEPTTGLHFHDISKLLHSFDALIGKGHSLLVVEHNTEVIKHADWVIDLGPEGGKKGGQLMFQGTVEDLKKSKTSITARYL
ncbi:MAG: excinuclease ABC subunit A [Bacteroidetes bacterium]|nr:MAG: excinuclease ABC subunit A [Bacteroidota bacterium]MBL1145896.1 excinuclease ABC subunit A [Bacteroidota bacterium]NOG58690.1 excinuclease ABC subunit UvrA [Bacteroidota bacterium]